MSPSRPASQLTLALTLQQTRQLTPQQTAHPAPQRGSVRGSERGSEQGSATAEVAILLPGLVLMLALVLATGAGAVAQIRCVDAARAGARMAARGEPDGVVLAGVRAAAPPGARVTIGAGAGLVTVEVRSTVALPLLGAPALTVGSRATARTEQGAEPLTGSAPGGLT